MKTVVFLFLITSCLQSAKSDPKIGECVLDDAMAIWKIMREDEGKFLVASYPYGEGAPVNVVTDFSPFKVVKCPEMK